jgi:hypothetical protein
MNALHQSTNNKHQQPFIIIIKATWNKGVFHTYPVLQIFRLIVLPFSIVPIVSGKSLLPQRCSCQQRQDGCFVQSLAYQLHRQCGSLKVLEDC